VYWNETCLCTVDSTCTRHGAAFILINWRSGQPIHYYTMCVKSISAAHAQAAGRVPRRLPPRLPAAPPLRPPALLPQAAAPPPPAPPPRPPAAPPPRLRLLAEVICQLQALLSQHRARDSGVLTQQPSIFQDLNLGACAQSMSICTQHALEGCLRHCMVLAICGNERQRSCCLTQHHHYWLMLL
jgi:hypothetical protein